MAKLSIIALFCIFGICHAGFIPGYKRSIPSGYWYFKLHTTPKTWHEANIICQSENAQLAVINSQEEAKIFSEELVKYPAASIKGHFRKGVPSWHLDVVSLGFHEKFGRGNYVTLNGTPLPESGYALWASGQPDNKENREHCGSMFRNGRLNDLPCDEPFMFICETTFPFTGEGLPENEPKCETFKGGYKLGSSIGDRFYKLHTKPKTWDEASLVCQTENAKLAVINSEEEAKFFVTELLKKSAPLIARNGTKPMALLGFHDRFKYGHFVTMNGEHLSDVGYEKWARGQPDNATHDEHCGTMDQNGQLHDISCSSQQMFFCEKSSIGPINAAAIRGLCTDVAFKSLTDEEITRGVECESYALGYQRAKTLHGDKFYKLHPEPKIWDDALLVCQSEQATLAVINTEEESRLYANEIAKNPTATTSGSFKDIVLLGFHDRLKHGYYETVQGKSLAKTGFYKWSTGQPDSTSKHCGSMFRNGLLNDVSCDEPHPFICEKTNINTYVLTETQARTLHAFP